MKNLIFIVGLTVLSFCSFGQVSDKPFDFAPLVDGGRLKGIPYTEKIKLLQLPEETLRQMSTEALLETCINYPLFHVITAYSNVQEGFSRISTDFNGFSELFNRPDLPKIIISSYESKKLSKLNSMNDDLIKGHFIAKVLYHELMISQNDVMDRLDINNLQLAIITSFDRYSEKNNFSISTFNRQFSLLVMGKTLKRLGGEESSELFKDSAVNEFLESPILVSQETSMKIISAASKYISKMK